MAARRSRRIRSRSATTGICRDASAGESRSDAVSARLSPAHLKRMIEVMKKLDRFTEPIVAVYTRALLLDAQRQPSSRRCGEVRAK